ncbi:hypothetical protein MMC06_002866 [Schaereria dolodes]|nr:hypothetical protein [Schaereria dolodes]
MASPEKTHKALTLLKIEGKPGRVYYPLRILSVPTQIPTSTQLLLSPTHLSLNHRDLFLRQHLYPSPSFTTPLLSDACCTVLPHPLQSLPSDHYIHKRVILNPGYGWVSDPDGPEDKAGYRILGGTSTNPVGVAQDVICVESSEVELAPSHLSSAEAAALPLTGLTAWRALVTKSGNAVAGANILITGIGGGVALMALLFAVKMGVKIWVTSGEEAKVTRANGLGAKGGIVYKEEGWEEKLKGMLAGEELDAVIDGAGGDVVDKATRLLKAGGVIISYGMTTGPRLPFSMSAVLKNIELRGSTMGSRKEFRDMVAFVAKEKIRPVVSRVICGGLENLEGIDELFNDMKEGKQFGKLVLEVGQGGEGQKSKL